MIEDTSRGLINNQNQNADNLQSDSHLPNNHYQDTEDLPNDSHNSSSTTSWSAEPAEGHVDDISDHVDDISGHGDDISAMTESSYTQPFGDR